MVVIKYRSKAARSATALLQMIAAAKMRDSTSWTEMAGAPAAVSLALLNANINYVYISWLT
jgi:hypothetical protein